LVALQGKIRHFLMVFKPHLYDFPKGDVVSDKRKTLRSKILTDLNKGEFKLGSRLPGEGELVVRYGISRATIRESIGMLVHEGVLACRRGSVTYVESLHPKRFNRSRWSERTFSVDRRRN